MSTQLDSDLFLLLLRDSKEARIRDRRAACLQSDVAKIHLALGGELACEEIERRLLSHLATGEYRRQEAELHHRQRVLRSQQRELAAKQERAA